MDLKTKLTAHLEKAPGLRVDELARALGEDRGNVHQVLHAHKDCFERDHRAATWIVKKSSDPALVPRPGPFGPAKALLAPGHTLKTISSVATCAEAAKILLANEYSTLPIVDASSRIIGVVTLESIVGHMLDERYSTIKAGTLAEAHVHTLRREANFVDGDAFIDTRVNWAEVQHVIVGTPRAPLGILTVADVWEKLNDFTEAFVLLFEIERDLRSLIATAAGDDLDTWLEHFGGHHPHGRPESLEECNFSEYLSLIRYTHAKPIIERHIGLMDTFKIDFREVNDIRNNVMHFKQHQVQHETCITLQQFRQRIRHAAASIKRELCAR